MKGKNSLNLIELNAIGDVTGKSLLHLQCHFGQDSISFARMGAKVTAVDFSDVAVKEAKKVQSKSTLKPFYINQFSFKKISNLFKKKGYNTYFFLDEATNYSKEYLLVNNNIKNKRFYYILVGIK